MKKTMIVLAVWLGVSVLAYADSTLIPQGGVRAPSPPSIIDDKKASEPLVQRQPQSTTNNTNDIDAGSGDDAATIYDPDPEADVDSDDVGESPAQQS